MTELEFHPLTLPEYDTVYAYMSAHGEGSCQHSFVSMFSLFEKYGDCICEKDGFLYTLRSHYGDEQYRVYLAPMGDGDLKAAFQNILDDAHHYGRKVKFVTLTQSYADFVRENFGDLFEYTEDRDLAEYMYRTEKMSTFSGNQLMKRRTETHKFWNTYGERATVKLITHDDFDEILAFEQFWLEQNTTTHDMHSLSREARAIEYQLAHYDELHLSGIVLRIDGVVRGYGYGTKLSDEFYDALIEKGDRSVLNIYRVLRLESVKQCATECTYVNMEEDLGIEGLRALKYAYKPEYLLNKYIVTEK